MDDWPLSRRVAYAAQQASGLGALAGAVELLVALVSMRLSMHAVDVAVMGASAVVAGAVLCAALSLVAAPLHAARPDEPAYRAIAVQIGTGGALLCLLFMLPILSRLWQEERLVAAAAGATLPLGAWFVFVWNARYWLAWVAVGKGPSWGWTPISWAGAALVVLGCAFSYPARDTGGALALEGDPNVLFVTVDGLRHDTMSGSWSTPRLSGLAAEGAAFTNAVTPTTSSLSAHATLFSGLHPLRHRAATDVLPLTTAARTLAEVFEEEGFATSAFASTVVTGAHSGLQQGFLTFDDHLGGVPTGVSQLRLASFMASLFVDMPVRRDAASVVSAWEGWFEGHRDVPFFSWVHLSDPLPTVRTATPEEADAAYAEAVSATDTAVGRLLDALEAAGVADRTLVVVVGTHGLSLGRTGRAYASLGLRDALVRVPLVVRAPGTWEMSEVTSQVRLMDVPQTVLAFAELDVFAQSEGVELLGYLRGARKASMWCSLLGRSPDGWLVGLRNNGIKYIRHIATEDEELYDVLDDPVESKNLVLEQPRTLEQARGLLAGEMLAVRKLDGLIEVPADVAARIARLGGR